MFVVLILFVAMLAILVAATAWLRRGPGPATGPKYHEVEGEDEDEAVRRAGTAAAEAVVVRTFRTMLRRDPHLTLDEAILRFENAPAGTGIVAFATRKGRTRAMYVSAYTHLFDRAQAAQRTERAFQFEMV